MSGYLNLDGLKLPYIHELFIDTPRIMYRKLSILTLKLRTFSPVSMLRLLRTNPLNTRRMSYAGKKPLSASQPLKGHVTQVKIERKGQTFRRKRLAHRTNIRDTKVHSNVQHSLLTQENVETRRTECMTKRNEIELWTVNHSYMPRLCKRRRKTVHFRIPCHFPLHATMK